MAKTYYSRKNVLSKGAKRGYSMYRRRPMGDPRASLYQPRDVYRGRIENSSSGVTVRMTKNVFFEDLFSFPLLTGNGYNMVFKANDIPNWSSIAAVYDQYKINWVSVTVIPKINVTSGALLASGTSVPVTQVQAGLCHSAIDYDIGGFSTTAGSGSVLAVYDTYKFSRGTSIHKRVLRPQAADTLVLNAGGTTTNAGMASRNTWFDSAQGAIQHYGIKFFLDDWESFGCSADVIVKYNISVRNGK